MARDSILEEATTAEQNNENEQNNSAEDTNDPEADDDEERVKLTQRMPPDLLEEVDRVQDELALPSRNATINFLVKQATQDF